MPNAFGVEHTVFSKAMTPEERAAKKAEQIRQMELRGIKPKSSTLAPETAETPKGPRRTAPSKELSEAVTKPDKYAGDPTKWTGAHPPRNVSRPVWEITRSQTKNWAIGAALAGAGAYGAKKIADRNRKISKGEKTRDAAATGLGAGAGLAAAKTGRNIAGWVGRETVKDQRYKNLDNRHGSEHRKIMSEHNKKYGAVTSNPDVDFAGNKKARYAYYRNYPKDVPGGKGQRLLALDGHPAVKRPVLAAGALVGGVAGYKYAQKQKKVEVKKREERRKPRRVPDYLSPVLPASAVRAYDNSHRNKLEAGATNLAAKVGGGGLGAAAGLGAAVLATKKVPALKHGVKVGSKKVVSRDTLKGWTQSTSAAAGGGVGGAIGGTYSLKRIQENPRYRYSQ